ncbi:MAG: DUF4435 domain-containing protein [Bacteroidota bacterium]
MENILVAVPQRSNVARHNIGILYDQFNDINFYFEDRGKEHFYYSLFKKLFPELKFEKIITLDGKQNIKNASALTEGSKKDVYIVDQDFDSIFNTIEIRINLFYLDRYSIENYLIEKAAFYEIIKEERVTINDNDIEQNFKIDEFLASLKTLLINLFLCFPLVYKYQLACGYYNLNVARDIDFNTSPISFKANYVSDYIQTVKNILEKDHPQVDFEAEVNSYNQHFEDDFFSINTPGKYLMSLIKYKITKEFGIINHSTNETFNIRAGKNCDLNSLNFLKEKINLFIN